VPLLTYYRSSYRTALYKKKKRQQREKVKEKTPIGGTKKYVDVKRYYNID